MQATVPTIHTMPYRTWGRHGGPASGTRIKGTRIEGISHEASERDARIPPLAYPRDRAGLHAGGCLGSSRARGRRGLPGAARGHGVPRSDPRGVPGDTPAVRGPLAPRPVV